MKNFNFYDGVYAVLRRGNIIMEEGMIDVAILGVQDKGQYVFVSSLNGDSYYKDYSLGAIAGKVRLVGDPQFLGDSLNEMIAVSELIILADRKGYRVPSRDLVDKVLAVERLGR